MLQVHDVRVVIGGHPAVAGASLSVAKGEVVALLGPSGSGKSTLLRAIAGLERVTTGEIHLDGETVADVPTHRRGVGLMFQDDALFPHRDVGENIAFGLRMHGMERPAREQRIAELLNLVGLAGLERRQVHSLSGGEQKRVALARALAPSPRVLLLDESLGALDRPLHDRLLDDLRRLFQEISQTSLYVTHDVSEAFFLGHRVAVMREGRIVQIATPEELWAAPVDAWIARFIGLANVEERGAIAVVTRPEGVVLRPDPSGAAIVLSSERNGPVVTLRGLLDDGREIVSVAPSLAAPPPGTRVRVEIDPAALSEVPAADRSPAPR